MFQSPQYFEGLEEPREERSGIWRISRRSVTPAGIVGVGDPGSVSPAGIVGQGTSGARRDHRGEKGFTTEIRRRAEERIKKMHESGAQVCAPDFCIGCSRRGAGITP